MIYGLILSLFFINFSANAADLNEILKNGEIKIAVPEAFAPFGSVGKIAPAHQPNPGQHSE